MKLCKIKLVRCLIGRTCTLHNSFRSLSIIHRRRRSRAKNGGTRNEQQVAEGTFEQFKPPFRELIRRNFLPGGTFSSPVRRGRGRFSLRMNFIISVFAAESQLRLLIDIISLSFPNNRAILLFDLSYSKLIFNRFLC